MMRKEPSLNLHKVYNWVSKPNRILGREIGETIKKKKEWNLVWQFRYPSLIFGNALIFVLMPRSCHVDGLREGPMRTSLSCSRAEWNQRCNTNPPPWIAYQKRVSIVTKSFMGYVSQDFPYWLSYLWLSHLITPSSCLTTHVPIF